ncbi:hypothetical protein KSS93_10990 [Pseudomonas xanthosomatis]|uniref:hypothetical protein n=1 Tax=Pseudomonas xanthosomatis TaxID=2842356 RepID=UPI001C3CF0E5|nr:hypothetical protein [Pseudomonas xanthosomatis]QXH48401.1 hypothetical protein KSS93_10990 [Pseudomonas xanthosomatis]
MNAKTFCLQGLLGRLLLTMAVGSLALPAMAAGTIVMAEKFENGLPGGNQCSVPVPAVGSGVTSIKLGSTSCKNDQVRYFRFVDVPSPTMVVFANDGECGGGSWRLGVRAYKHPTTSEWKTLQEIRDTEMNKPVAVGIEKVDDNGKTDQIPGKLSCMEIYPPSP